MKKKMTRVLSPLSHLRWKITASILLILFALLPGTTPIDGPPLAPLEFLLLATLLLLTWKSEIFQNLRWRQVFFVSLSALLVIKLLGAWLLPYGWTICLQREIAPETLTTPCEPSIQFPDGRNSFIVPEIAFNESQMPLYFMNDKVAFNFSDGDEIDRYSMLYSFTATAFFEKQDHPLTVTTNVPDIHVSLNDIDHEVSPDEKLELSLADHAINHLTISYTTNHRNSDTLFVETDAAPFYQTTDDDLPSQTAVTLYRLGSSILLIVLLGLATLGLIHMFIQTSPQAQRHYWYTGIFIILLLASQTFQSQFFAFILIAIIIGCAHIPQRDWQRSWVIPILLYFCLSGTFIALNQPPGHLQILEGGDDPLTNEGYSRLVIIGEDWRTRLAGTPNPNPFYYQPLYRYQLAAIHYVMGEDLWPIFTVQTFLLVLVVALTARLAFRWGGSLAVGLFAAALGYVFISQDESLIKLVATTLRQHGLALPLYFLALLATIEIWENRNYRFLANISLGILWGIAVMTRTDLLAAAAGLIFFIALRFFKHKPWNKKTIGANVWLIIGFAIPLMFVLARNVIISQQWLLLPTSGFINLLPEFQALPDVTRESFGVATLLTTIPAAYLTKLPELFRLLWANVQSEMLVSDPAQYWLWFAVIMFATLALFGTRRRTSLAILLLSTLTPMVIASFFIHRVRLPAVSHYSFLAAWLMPFVVSAALSSWPRLVLAARSVFQRLP